jgi:hypothetical protein
MSEKQLVLQRLLESALATAIRMMQQRLGLAPSSDCHHQSIGDELARHGRAHRPADHPARDKAGKVDLG